MNTNKKLATAALLGLLSTGFMTASIAHESHDKPAEKSASSDKKMEKHACKGQNACKGQGGDGKNACKGHGSCRTDSK